NDPASTLVRTVMAQSYGNLFTQGYRDVFQRALDQDAALSSALQAAPTINTVFPDSDLGQQLGMVAKLIAVRSNLGLSRQVFFCATGGYDTHSEQVGTTPIIGTQADLLSELDAALSAFYNATVELGVQNDVTT